MSCGQPSAKGGATMRYAYVDGQKVEPTKGAKGVCLACDGQVLAKCGKIKVHHWAHNAGECDPWAEPMGAWHRAWQDVVQREHVEVVRKPHRADIVGEGGTVIELQHSSIDSDTIAAREAFYGDMVWLFDATHRFRYFRSGPRAFFTMERYKHVHFCRKPVYLDFGDVVIQAERIGERTWTGVDGYGLLRDHRWVLDNLIGRNHVAGVDAPTIEYLKDHERKGWRVLGHRDTAGCVATSPDQHAAHEWPSFGTEVLGVQGYEGAASVFIERMPELANGWDAKSVAEVQQCFQIRWEISKGSLFALPIIGTGDRPMPTVNSGMDLIDRLEAHGEAGRMPPLKANARKHLKDLIEYKERVRAQRDEKPGSKDAQGMLFGPRDS